MKTKNRLLARVLLLLMVVFSVIGLTSCNVYDTCSHQWGEWSVTKNATCTETGVKERTCAKCGKVEIEVIALTAHIPNADDGDCTTAITCSVCGEVTTPANASHTGGTATCKNKAKCAVCGMEYGELAEHIPSEDDGDCTTAITCSVCGEVTTPANASHTGGTATCKNKANCAVCGMEYFDPGNHEGEIIWIKHINFHYQTYSCCYEQVSLHEEHSIVDGVCSVCGFNPTIAITSKEVAPGDSQVEIAVSLSDNPCILGLMIKIQYSPDVFELTKAESGEALDALMFTSPTILATGCTFLWDGAEIKDEEIKDGEFLILTFNISENAPEGEYSILLNVTAYDNDLKPINLIITGGKITIKND